MLSICKWTTFTSGNIFVNVIITNYRPFNLSLKHLMLSTFEVLRSIVAICCLISGCASFVTVSPLHPVTNEFSFLSSHIFSVSSSLLTRVGHSWWMSFCGCFLLYMSVECHFGINFQRLHVVVNVAQPTFFWTASWVCFCCVID